MRISMNYVTRYSFLKYKLKVQKIVQVLNSKSMLVVWGNVAQNQLLLATVLCRTRISTSILDTSLPMYTYIDGQLAKAEQLPFV